MLQSCLPLTVPGNCSAWGCSRQGVEYLGEHLPVKWDQANIQVALEI